MARCSRSRERNGSKTHGADLSDRMMKDYVREVYIPRTLGSSCTMAWP
jgi:hypothetical protein